MGTTRLYNSDSETFWAHHSWPAFDHFKNKEACVVVLPVHGFADHGLGLPLDSEEVVGAALLRGAVETAKSVLPVRVLPPLRFALAPYPSSYFGIDAETAHDLIREIAASVQAAGFKKLLFFNTSPWNEELIDAASRDTRASLNLQTFVVNLSGLDLGLHPASRDRVKFQAVAMNLLGQQSITKSKPAEISDTHFRPGRYRQPQPIKPDPELAATAIFAFAAERLSKLLSEVHARPPLGSRLNALRPVALSVQPAPLGDIAAWPTYRHRYLPAMTAEELRKIPNKKNSVVLVTTGAIEQHGPHLPVGVDAIMGQAWLDRCLPKLPKNAPVYVAPAITFGKSNEHIGFPGTVWISAKTLRRLLLSIAKQLSDLGFRTMAIVNTHGGNSAVLIYTLREIQETFSLRAGMVSSGHKPDISPQEATYGFHAGEWETSAMLEVTEGLVRMDCAVCEFPARLDDPGELRPEDAPAIYSWITSDVSLSGVMGDATAATREKGHRWMEDASSLLAKNIEALIPRKKAAVKKKVRRNKK